jgi:hypothetical protein
LEPNVGIRDAQRSLGATLLAAGMALGFVPQESFTIGGWLAGASLILYAGWARLAWSREFGRAPSASPVGA